MRIKTIVRPVSHSLWAALSAFFLTGIPTATAQVTRLANDEPEIRVRADGRNGVCDVLTFTPDGNELLAVGEDKVIHRWGVGGAALRSTKPIYWNTFREQRGSIYAMALSTTDPAQTLVAIGGNGKLNPDVAVFDLKTGELLGAVTPLCPQPGEYAAARQVVWSLAFHPKNTELAIGDELGNVWVCPLVGGKPVTAQSKRVVAGKAVVAHDLRVVWVGYTADARLVYAKRDGGVYVVGQAAPLFRWKMGAVDKVVVSGDGLVLAARPAEETKAGSHVEIRALAGGAGQSVSFKQGNFPNRIALDNTGSRLAVGISVYGQGAAAKPFSYEPPGELIVYDIRAEPKVIASVAREARPDQIAFHPDGKRLATADSIDHGTTLWTVDGGQLRSLDSNIHNGRQLWAVGMTDDNRYLCFKDKRNANPPSPNERADPKAAWNSFDLNGEQRGWAAGAKSPVPPEVTREGWKILPGGVDGYKWYVVEPNGQHRVLPLDELRDDRPRCYTFLPGTKPGSVRVAVGHAWGASVFDLVAGQEPVRVRRLNGHAGYVTAIAPAYKGKGLVTCGHDQAIAIWNLTDFPSEPLMGAAFANVNGKVIATAVDRGSPADEAGLSAGDEITAFTRGDSPTPVDPREWLAKLRDPQPMREMLWGIERPGLAAGVDKRAKTALLHRPAAKFIPFADGEWLLYTYRQSYYDCSANGDHYIEWLVSKDRADKKPDVFAVEQFAKFLHKPDKVSSVITLLDREPAKALLPDLFPPTVTLKSDIAKVGAKQDVTVSATVIPSARQDGKVNEVVRVELWLNRQHLLETKLLAGEVFAVGKPIPVTFKVPGTVFRSGPNVLEARGVGKDDPESGCGAGLSPPLQLIAEGSPHKKRLFVLVAGITQYEPFTKSLPGARRDALNLGRFWEELQTTGGYATDADTKLRLLINEQVTKSRLLEEMKAISKVARPDDIFVLCLAGHGANMDLEGATLKENGPDWYYIIPRVDATTEITPNDVRNTAKLKQAFVKDTDLADVLIRMDCQPLVFIDCCYSGAASATIDKRALHARTTTGRGLTQGGFGPVVISSCSENERAWEVNDRGIFSHNALQAMGPKFAVADKDKDGKLNALEFYEFVVEATAKEVAEIIDDKTGKPPTQRPTINPPAKSIEKLIIVPQSPDNPKK